MSTQRRNKNSDAIRILQRDRDVSARATHLKAEIGMVPNSTIERKIMSTKTSIKRIALVAAAALTLGGFSAVSASATTTAEATPVYVSAADAGANPTAAAATMTASAVAGAYNYVKLTSSTNVASGSTLGVTVATTTGAKLSVYTQPSPGSETVTVSTDGLSATSSGRGSGTVLKLSTPAVGSIVVTVSKITDSSGNVSTTALQTITITVNAASIVGTVSVANSTSTLSMDATAIASETATATKISGTSADSTTAVLKGSGSIVATIRVALKDTQSTPGFIASGALSATISGSGLLKGTGSGDYAAGYISNPGRVASSTTDAAAGVAVFAVYGDNTSGVGTVTISYTDGNSVTTVISTETITFYSSTVASIKVAGGAVRVPLTVPSGFAPSATHGLSTVNSGHAASATTDVTVVSITAADSNGNAIPGTDNTTSALFTVTSSNTAVATAGSVYYNSSLKVFYPVIAAVGEGTTTIKVVDAATGLIAASTDIAVASPIVASATYAASAATVDAGTSLGYVVTAKNAAGNLVADGTYTGFFGTAPISSVAVQGTVASTAITTTNGVAKSAFYAPLQAGTVKIAGGVLGTSSALFATALQGATVPEATFSVNGADMSSSLAYDAASAATDAANNAYEEAQNATQAASDALAAVKALAVQVKALIALVNKIKAKLKA